MNTFFTPDLIFFVVIAAFLILRLRSVLGKRTGNEKRPKDVFMYQDTNFEDIKTKSVENKKTSNFKTFKNEINKKVLSGNKALEKIRLYDRNFSVKKFLSGAKKAYEMIIKSYASGEIIKIKKLLEIQVFSTFSKKINLRKKNKQTLDHTFVSIKSADIEKIDLKENIVDIVVKFVSEQVNLLKNNKGKIIEGNNEYIENHTDYWTFTRDLKSSNPNWKLVVTKSE